ncbi:methylenetetrahydrofolate reductase [Sinomonas notoginsengisoli]|uniref:methylenetetrahydrofolate reductase n=1 Tax=Sinomonas notoginsengisoli TaxID=1457311 RepID=UPI0027E1244A|nr:methylenetetrahydrofolate reductase [Sinomonas notoginsengisoli]
MARTAPAANSAASLELIDGFSLEMTGKDVQALAEAKDRIPSGTRISVTFLGNEDLAMRIAAAQAVLDRGFVPVPHVSARRLKSQGELEEFLGRLQEIGASEHIFTIGGDPAVPEGPYEDSLAVISSGVLQQYGVHEVGIGGYPEGHPDISRDALEHAFWDKVAALKDQGLGMFVTTQFAFDTEPVVAWIDAVRARGIDGPIRVGTPGPAGIRRLLNFARRFGVGANAMIVKKYGFSLTNLMGDAGPDHFVDDLAAVLASAPSTDDAGSGLGIAGHVGLHFYTFGGLAATADWARRFTDERS